MQRLIHNQTVSGGILINDIDDGLPNKSAKHNTADRHKYHRDGNSLGNSDKSVEPDVNFSKQKCYVPFYKPTDHSVPGFIDLAETDRVLMSLNKGVISGFQGKGLITVVSFTSANVAVSTVTAAQIGVPGAGELTITGTNLTSLTPNYSKVVITGTGAVTLTQAQILAASGSFSATSIVIPASLIPGIAEITTFVQVLANDQLSNTFEVTT